MIDIRSQVKSDESFVAKCRLHQSKYRATLMPDWSYSMELKPNYAQGETDVFR
jgi:hypothetical protein